MVRDATLCWLHTWELLFIDVRALKNVHEKRVYTTEAILAIGQINASFSAAAIWQSILRSLSCLISGTVAICSQ